MAKQKKSKQKKINVRVDFTPMVDMMMLLITFFMLCTSLSKPQTMELTMPSNDKNIQQQDQTATKASQTITIYVCGDNKVFHVDGLPNYNDPKCMKETTWGSKGIRKVLINHVIEDGSTPVQAIMEAKAKLDAKKLKEPKKYTDQVYNDELTKIKAGDVDGEKIPVMTIIIKATDNASYKNMVDALDEMQICSIGKYVIDKINPDDMKLLKLKGVK
ncbi:MAG TPA: biopolymer transporter ExbD [Xylanibacter oryzae]|uniref:ExbD/TolR family protein n=1 Tax=Xylanibacter oryzae TaxID=185293 RepID=UPI0004AF9810|nr:biopolymer transporter ExbD [Xylanibacter oryzae]HRN15525.1 biopolymer transporter ExbD [Xylanibacter oryzae]